MRTTRTLLLALTILPITGCLTALVWPATAILPLGTVTFGQLIEEHERRPRCRKLWPHMDTQAECDARAAYEERQKRGLAGTFTPDQVIFGVQQRDAPQGWRVVFPAGDPQRQQALDALRTGSVTYDGDLFAIAKIRGSGYVFVDAEMVKWPDEARIAP